MGGLKFLGWAICQPAGHSIVNWSFTANMISFIFIEQWLKDAGGVPAPKMASFFMVMAGGAAVKHKLQSIDMIIRLIILSLFSARRISDV